LRIHVERHGGHCGFLQDYRLRAWSQDLIHDALLRSG
jgi:predicted alpha/beta-fold hydrolase